MKSAIVFILILIVAAFAEAKTEMTLYVSNHLGFRKQDVIRIEGGGKIFFNDVPVPKKLLSQAQPSLKTLAKMPNEKRRFCYENQYNYSIDENGKKKEIHACAEGKEFARIAMAFSKIQQVIAKSGK